MGRRPSLAKILAHNICCLIQSHYELGIEAKFWDETPTEIVESESSVPTDWVDAFAWV